jgi:hypothetical protein
MYSSSFISSCNGPFSAGRGVILRTPTLPFVLVLIGSLASALAAESEPPHDWPHSGCAAWQSAATLTLRGASEAGGLKGDFAAIVDIATGRHVTTKNYGVYGEAAGFDGRLDWAKDRSGASHQLNSDPARAIAVTQAWLRRRGWCEAVAARGEVERKPDTNVRGVAASVWQYTPSGGIPAVLRFDPSGVLLESEVRLWGNREIRNYSDWRDIGHGLRIPFLERIEDPEDESDETITLTSAIAGQRRAAALVFAQPSRPHDYGIANGARSATVRYEDDGVGRIFVPVVIDGQGPFPFELDTGGHFILSSDTAKRLQLRPVGNFSATGAGTGIAHEGITHVSEIRIGTAFIRDQPVWVRPSRNGDDRGMRPPRAGILGLELFERFAVHLSRNEKTVTLTPLESFHPESGGIVLPIRFTEDAPVTSGSFNGIRGDFELDSGDAGPAIIEGYWAEHHGLGARLAQGIVWAGGSAGGDYQEIVTRGDLTLGPVKLPHEVISYVGLVIRGSESTEMQAGVVGESSMYRFDMTYDYGHHQVWIDPATDIVERPFNRTGLRLRKDASGDLLVSLVVASSPAAVAALAPEDRILSIDGRPAAALSLTDASVMMSGAVGTELTLSVVSKSGGEAHSVALRMAEILP